jgi:hypothetical protein
MFQPLRPSSKPAASRGVSESSGEAGDDLTIATQASPSAATVATSSAIRENTD